MQWVLCFLTDDDFVEFMVKCREHLSPNGVIVAKENVSDDKSVFDSSDNSIYRNKQDFEYLFHRAGLRVKRHQTQEGFPLRLIPVKMWALVPQDH